MSFQAMTIALSVKLPGIKKILLLVIANYTNDKNQFWPSYQTLADEAGLSKRSVIKYIKEFEELGLIHKKVRKKEKKDNLTNLYTFTAGNYLKKNGFELSINDNGFIVVKKPKVVSEANYPSAGDSPPPVQEVHPSSAGDSPKPISEPINKPINLSREANGACSAPVETQLDNTHDEKPDQVKVKSRQEQIRPAINILVEPKGRTRAIKAIQKECRAMTVESITNALFTLYDGNIDTMAERLLTADEVIGYMITVARNE